MEFIALISCKGGVVLRPGRRRLVWRDADHMVYSAANLVNVQIMAPFPS